MGKGTDKLYITHSEWNSSDSYSASSGSNVRDKTNNSSFKRLPFAFCALSLQPFHTPVCTAEGLVFDHENIIRWLMQHDTNPVTGKPLKRSDLITLSLAKNDAGELVDPVTYKVLTDNTHVVAIRHGDSANVFAWDTIERLNIKAKSWKDLVSDEPFTRQDIITLQDPQNLESRNLSDFSYLRNGEDALIPKEAASINTAAMGNAADLKIMKAKQAVAKAREERNKANTAAAKAGTQQTSKSTPTPTARSAPTPYNATRHTTGQAAASFTSTGLTPTTSASLALMTDEEYLLKPRRVKQKGYVRLSTTLGDLTLEVMPEHAPKAVWNFIRLVQKGYYNGVLFHRNIRHFMIQTGDPTGTGRGGSSIWNKNFEDEFDGPNKHDSRGVVSMANKGRNSNSSQFFVTYRPAAHLDRKHTIFGKVAEGLDVLKLLEEVEVDANNRPKEEIKIIEAIVLIDPFEEFMKAKEARDAAEASRAEKTDDDRTTWTGKRIRADGRVEDNGAGSVGKYLRKALPSAGGAGVSVEDEFSDMPVKKKARSGGGGFGNFDGW
ncbi:hypothetical protein DV735_g4540, partial [Chaetothyriales sp. CBS 134920]